MTRDPLGWALWAPLGGAPRPKALLPIFMVLAIYDGSRHRHSMVSRAGRQAARPVVRYGTEKAHRAWPPEADGPSVAAGVLGLAGSQFSFFADRAAGAGAAARSPAAGRPAPGRRSTATDTRASAGRATPAATGSGAELCSAASASAASGGGSSRPAAPSAVVRSAWGAAAA